MEMEIGMGMGMLEVQKTEVEVGAEMGRRWKGWAGASLRLLQQQLADEVLGHLGGLAEAALLKLVGARHDIGERLSVCLTLEGGQPAEPVGTQQSH